MAWIKASDVKPPEGEPVLVHDNAQGRAQVGRYVGGRWYVEDARDGRLTEIVGVTHWGWLLDSETRDDSEDD